MYPVAVVPDPKQTPPSVSRGVRGRRAVLNLPGSHPTDSQGLRLPSRKYLSVQLFRYFESHVSNSVLSFVMFITTA